jgi:hypothetical protein
LSGSTLCGEDEASRSVSDVIELRHRRPRLANVISNEKSRSQAGEPPVIQFNNRLLYFSVRADRGNDISKENPSFVEGAAGRCG